MADLNDLIRSKKVKEFVRKEKSRPWTVSSSESEQIYKSKAPPITDVPEIKDDQLEDQTAEPKNRNKLRPNVSQSEAKVEPQLRPNVSQSEAKVEPNLSHNKMKLEPQLRPKYEPKLSQSEAKVEPKIDLSALVGLQKNMLLSIYESCRFTGSKITSAIAIENLAHSAESTPAAARKAVQRLEEKGVLIRKEFKNGRGGWTKYELPDVVYQQVMFSQTEAKVEPNLGQTRAKLRPEVEPEVRPESSSSSSSLLNNKTTTTDPAWNEIDLSPLDGLIGFTRSHVEQIIRRNVLTPEQVQMSIYAFAFDLEENGKGKAINSPLNYFMGVLNKGVYAPPENYESPKDRANRRYNEWKKRESEKNAILEKENMEFAFADWVKELTQEAREQVVPESQFAKQGSAPYRLMLRQYFCDTVWPSIKEKIARGEI